MPHAPAPLRADRLGVESASVKRAHTSAETVLLLTQIAPLAGVGLNGVVYYQVPLRPTVIPETCLQCPLCHR